MDRLHWRCFHVLPLVYDQSLSYYEVLCKVTSKLNEVIEYVVNNLEMYLQEIVNEAFVDVVYNSETETITFTIENNNT